jgi:adenosine kinase
LSPTVARILICGTLAYDDIGAFATSWSAETRNVKLERLDRGFGGCAMNMAYNLAGLGHEAVPFVYAGDDYVGDYARHTARHGISEAGVFRVAGSSCARGIVLTGGDGVQFTAFYPGPSGSARWPDDLYTLLQSGPFDAVIVAPDLPEKMTGCSERTRHVAQRVWCPGQYAELLEPRYIEALLRVGGTLVVNRHEWNALGRRVSEATLIASMSCVVVTDGANPVHVLPDGDTVPVPPPASSSDPTGCGDAFVAGLVDAVLAGRETRAAVQAGIRLAGQCLGYPGAQRHPVDGAVRARPTTG